MTGTVVHMLAVLLFLLTACGGRENKPVVYFSDTVTLQYQPKGTRPQSVYVSGSFNNWKIFDSEFRMVWEPEKRVFSIKFSLKPGTYMYKFIVDGEWIVDPRATRVVNDNLGGKMGVFLVRTGQKQSTREK